MNNRALDNTLCFLWDNLQATLEEIAPNGHFFLAYSGGLDSRFMAHAAQKTGFAPLLLHVRGPHVPPTETAYARRWAAWRGLPLRELTVDPLSLPAVASGARDRCYACKFTLFSRLLEVAEGLPLCDGTHASDAQGYRPGRKALDELGIRSPLALAGLTKSDIRELGRLTGLEQADQSARPCLLTRLDYGMRPTPELLSTLSRGEQAVAETLRLAFGEHTPDFRLRLTGAERWELHLRPRSERRELPPPLEKRLARALKDAADVRVTRIAVLDSLSGYFDRKRPSSNTP